MFKLTEDELQNAFEAINHHGYSALLPSFKEWDDVKTSWAEIRRELAVIDLDTYAPHTPLRVYAPKNRVNIRSVTLLHPQDIILYTALVLLVKNEIEQARVSVRKKKVFSYRINTDDAKKLYKVDGAYQNYKARLFEKANQAKVKIVAIADIADFYPRIYQHRLKNVLLSISTCQRTRDVARVLVDKLLLKIAGGASYGIPVGPYASRVLAEALLIDVDAALQSIELDFVRWVDDISIFCKTEQEAQYALFFLAKWLFENHGLTLQSAKTKILKKESFLVRLENDYEERLRRKNATLMRVFDTLNPYNDENDEAELEDEEIAEINAVNLTEMLTEALTDEELVDYEMAAFILGRLASLEGLNAAKKSELIDVVLENIEHLYPISESVARFFLSFSGINAVRKKRIAKALLKPIKNRSRIPVPDFYIMWILSVFAESSDWNQADDILAVYRNNDSQLIARYAACALASTGNRTHALSIRENYTEASPLVKLSILHLCSKKLGADEYRHFKRMQTITDP